MYMEEFAKMWHDGNFKYPQLVELNNLSYCEAHVRNICTECKVDNSETNKMCGGFHVKGIAQFPITLRTISNPQLRMLFAKRWICMQRELYTGPRKPFTKGAIRLPQVDVPDEVKLSPGVLQGILLQLFRELQGITSAQRYYHAYQSKIMLQDYEIFKASAVLYEEEISEQLSRGCHLHVMRGGNLTPGELKYRRVQKSKASILNTFGFFLELNTLRTFWRVMELTSKAFMQHIEKFDEEFHARMILSDKAKETFLRWVAHFFWSLEHAQFRVAGLQALQQEVYEHGVFPFYPYTLEALEDNADINLTIIKLCKAPLHDLPLLSFLFSEFRKTNAIHAQMKHVNVGLMGAIDEMSSRFRAFEKLVLAARLVASEDEIKSAIMTFKFDPTGMDMQSKTDDVMEFISTINESDGRAPTPRKASVLNKLIAKENIFRRKYSDRVLKPPFDSSRSNGFSKEMFDAFKSNFTLLYRESIRREWKTEEHSLLGLDVAKRFRDHDAELKKKKKKKAPPSTFEEADMVEVRSVPESGTVDHSLCWEMGDGTLEKYVPPVVKEKIKTRKQGTMEKLEECSTEDGPETPLSSSNSIPDGESTTSEVKLPLDKLKESDITTRDILWRKVKGTLKWSHLMQFLSRLGCQILNLDGSKRKVVNTHSSRSTVLHRPHPGDECRPDQRESYRVHIEDWLNIRYSDLVTENEVTDPQAEGSNP